MTTKRPPKTLTADDIRYAVRLAQRVRMLDLRYMQGRAGHTPLKPALREAQLDRARGLKMLTCGGLDEYGTPPGATLTPEEQAVRVLDDVPHLPRREQSDTTSDGFETFEAYLSRIAGDPDWAKRAPLIRESAIGGSVSLLKAIAADPWAGWPVAARDMWQALKVGPRLAQGLDAGGITPDLLAPITGMVRCLPEGERSNLIGAIASALRHGSGVVTW